MGRPKNEKVHDVEDLQKLFQKEFKENRKILASIKKQIDNQATKSLKQLTKCADALDRICKLNEEVEATLCNVMLAIKQNSYLQAWYPEQQGFEEGLYSGVHPVKQKRIDKRYVASNSRPA